MSAAERPWAGRRIHVVGVGGAGMSAYARAAHALGADVTGSDFDQIHHAIDQFKIPTIDLRETFRSANLPELQVVPKYDIHPNIKGHRMIFDSLSAQLRAREDVYSVLTGGTSSK